MGFREYRDLHVLGYCPMFFMRHIALLVLYVTSCSGIFHFQETRKYDFLCSYIFWIVCFDASIAVFVSFSLLFSPLVCLQFSIILNVMYTWQIKLMVLIFVYHGHCYKENATFLSRMLIVSFSLCRRYLF